MARKIKTGLIILIAVVFLLFYTIGYDMLWEENPEFSSPLLTTVLLWLITAILIIAIATAVTAIIISFRKHNGKRIINGIPVKKITWITCAGMAILVIAAILFSDGNTILINGKVYEDVFWLKTADTLIYISALLIIVAIVLTGFSALKRQSETRKKTTLDKNGSI